MTRAPKPLADLPPRPRQKPTTATIRPFDVTALVYFEAVARYGTVSGAASALRIAASALSRRIRALEDELHAPLFERLPRGMRVTSAGEILLHHTKLGFHELDRARGLIEDLRGLRRGHVRLAVAESAMRGLVIPVLSAFWRSHPHIEVAVDVVGSTAATRQVETGDAELAVTFAPRRRFGRLEPIAEAGFLIGAVMTPDHELANRDALNLRDAVGFPVLLADATLMLHDAVRSTADLEQMFPRPRLATNSITLMSLLAVHGAGIAFKTRLGVLEEIRRGELVFIPLAGKPLPIQRVVLWCRGRQDLSQAALALATALAGALTGMSEI